MKEPWYLCFCLRTYSSLMAKEPNGFPDATKTGDTQLSK